MKRIKVSFGFASGKDADVLSQSSAICNGLAANAAYPNPPVDLAALKAATDAFSAAIVEARDGSRTAIAGRKNQRERVIKLLRPLATYVEVTCMDDWKIF